MIINQFFLTPKIHMFSSLRNRDQLSIVNLNMFLNNENSLDNFIYFANNALIKGELKEMQASSFKQSREAIIKAESKHGIKILGPLKALLVRMLEASWGLTQLHLLYLQLCNKHSIPSEALFILQFPGFFSHLKKKAIFSFINVGSTLLILLQRYVEAYQLVKKASMMEYRDLDSTILQLFMKYVILCNYAADEISLEFVASLKDSMKTNLRERQDQLRGLSQVIEGFLALRHSAVASQAIRKYLIDLNLIEAYELSKHRKLKQHIQSSVKGNNWRIKATKINNQNVGDYEVIKSVNNARSIYKYDHQNSLLYFNHQLCNQNQLNHLISKAFQIQQEVNNCKVQRREEFGMGRMGGMGGMMGMLGMGGMGMGMGRSKRSHSPGSDDENDYR